MKSINKIYKEEVIEKFKKEFGIDNALAAPRISKVTVNVGVGKGLNDAKYIELVEQTLQRITGQKPAPTKAKKSISAFKIREGNIVGYKVTLRGAVMNDFLNKLIHVTLPRVRDFHGIDPKKNIDEQGNMTLGFKEHIIFPEIKSDEVERVLGLEISITTTADSKQTGLFLFKALGFPFKKDN